MGYCRQFWRGDGCCWAVAMYLGQLRGANLVGAGIGMMIGGVAMMLMPKIDNPRPKPKWATA